MMRKFYFVTKIIKLLLCISVSFMQLDCSATGPLYKEAQLSNTDNALIYIYRPDKFGEKAVTFDVYINNKLIAGLKNNGYIAIELNPGKYVIDISHTYTNRVEKKTIQEYVKKKDKIYIKFEPQVGSNFTQGLAVGMIVAILTRSGVSGGSASGSGGEYKFEIIDSEIAKKEIASARLQKYVDFLLN